MHSDLLPLLEQGYNPMELVAIEHQYERCDSCEAMGAVRDLPDECKVLLDGGTFAHMLGTGVSNMIVNRQQLD